MEDQTEFEEITGGTMDGQQQPFSADDITGNTKATGEDFEPENIPQTLNAGALIPAEFVTNIINIVMPRLIVLLVKTVAKKNVNAKQLSATKEEKEMIEPVLQNYLNSINFNMVNPLNALVFTLVAVYGSKTFELISSEIPKETLKETRPQAHKGGRPAKQGAKPSRYMMKKAQEQQEKYKNL